jgi:predicted dehydrogenase
MVTKSEQSPQNSKKKTVRLGLIGLGGIGQYYAKLFQEGRVEHCQLAAICSGDPAKRAQFDGMGMPTFADSRALIRSGEVDAVLIATPHYAHTTIGIDALQNGLHVLVEKPISVHKADAERLLAAHLKKGQVFGAMFQLRVHPTYAKIKQLIERGELGEIRRVNWIVTDWFRPEIYYASGGWRATWRGEGGGVLLNQCPHNLDLLQWLTGMPVRVRAHCHLGKYHEIEVEDEVTAYFEYKNGATGVFITSTGEAPGTNRLEIAGERGKLVSEGGKLTFTRNEVPAGEFSRKAKDRFAMPPVWNIEIPVAAPEESHAALIGNFAQAILEGTPLVAPAAEGLRSVELANAMLYSSLTGKTVEFPLDGRAYERLLSKLIRESQFEKKLVRTTQADMAKSFR